MFVNHFSEGRDVIKGTSDGVAFEWAAHNVANYICKAVSLVGADVSKAIDQTNDADVGATIFSDTHKTVGTIMKISYVLSNPCSALMDALIHLVQ